MLSARRLSAEAEIFRFVACCGELTGTISLVFLSCRPASKTTGGLSRARCGDSAEARSFSNTE